MGRSKTKNKDLLKSYFNEGFRETVRKLDWNHKKIKRCKVHSFLYYDYLPLICFPNDGYIIVINKAGSAIKLNLSYIVEPLEVIRVLSDKLVKHINNKIKYSKKLKSKREGEWGTIDHYVEPNLQELEYVIYTSNGTYR